MITSTGSAGEEEEAISIDKAENAKIITHYLIKVAFQF